MYIPVTSRPQLHVPVYAPPGTDLTQVSVQLAFMADTGAEPGSGDWVTAAWDGTEAALLIGPGTGTVLASGEYMVWVAIGSGSSRPVMPSGRLRVGDAR